MSFTEKKGVSQLCTKHRSLLASEGAQLVSHLENPTSEEISTGVPGIRAPLTNIDFSNRE